MKRAGRFLLIFPVLYVLATAIVHAYAFEHVFKLYWAWGKPWDLLLMNTYRMLIGTEGFVLFLPVFWMAGLALLAWKK